MPNLGQISLLILAVILLAVGQILSLTRMRRDSESLRLAAKACTWLGITFCVAVIAWHATARRNWLPLDDNFEALTWLGLILALFVMYVQRTHPIGGLDWFVMPLVILLLVGAAIFGRTEPRQYLPTTWSWIHRLFSYGGAIAFAVAGATGAMYLVAHRRLRRKTPVGGPRLGSLERLERVTLMSVTLGFAMLTLGAVTGFVWVAFEKRPMSVWKIVLTGIVWVIFGLVLHSPINPSFRGRRAAILSIVGCVLMLGLLVTVQMVGAP